MTEQQQKWNGISAFALHMLAMGAMLCDHLWASVVSIDILTWIGRIAFPLFAFLLVEGYFHTRSVRKYALRLLAFALISEIPFNLFCSGAWFYPVHQNVLWTLLLSLLCIHLIEMARRRAKKWLTVLVIFLVAVIGYLIGFVTMIDYYGYGVLMALVFYLFRGRRWYCLSAQILLLGYINWEMMGGLSIPLDIFGRTFYLVQQGTALLALIPIWLYRGKQGPYSRVIKYSFYAFYPLHMLLLFLVQRST